MENNEQKQSLYVDSLPSELTIDVPSDNVYYLNIACFEKLEKEIMSLNGALDIPLIIGELSPMSSASEDINNELRKSRPRDISIPQT